MPKAKGKITRTDIERLPAKPRRESVLWDGQMPGFGVRCYTSGKKSYVVRWSAQRRKGWHTIGTVVVTPLADARSQALQFLAKIERGELPPRRNDPVLTKPRTVADLIERWLAEGPVDRPNKRESSWYKERNTLQNHVLPLLGSHDIDEVRSATVAKMQADVAAGRTAAKGKTKSRRVQGGPSAGTHAVRALSSAFGWAIEREWVARNPCAAVHKLPDGARHRYLSEAEAVRLFEVIDEMVAEGEVMPIQADCIKLIALSGARSGEIRALRWTEVDFERRMILLPPSRHKAGGSNKPKTIPLSDAALDIIRSRQHAVEDDDIHVFTAYSMLGYVRDIRHSWLKICTRMGLHDFRIHDLRHAYASFAINAGESLQNIGANLGHSRTTTTERYAHLVIDTRRPVADGVAAVYRRRSEPAATDEQGGIVVPFQRRQQ